MTSNRLNLQDLFDTLLIFPLRKEINLMKTQKEKQNQPTVRRPALLEANICLSKEIDEWSKLLDLDNSSVMVEPSEKQSWLNKSEKESA